MQHTFCLSDSTVLVKGPTSNHTMWISQCLVIITMIKIVIAVPSFLRSCGQFIQIAPYSIDGHPSRMSRRTPTDNLVATFFRQGFRDPREPLLLRSFVRRHSCSSRFFHTFLNASIHCGTTEGGAMMSVAVGTHINAVRFSRIFASFYSYQGSSLRHHVGKLSDTSFDI